MEKAIFGLFRPLEYDGPSIATVHGLRFVLLGCMLIFPLQSIYLPFLERDISIVNWILEFYYFE